MQREYDFRVRENPYDALYREMEKVLYGGNPLSRHVLGTPESIASFSIEAAQNFHAETHQLGNAVLLVQGQVAAEQLQQAIDALPEAQSIEVAPIALPPDDPIRDGAEVRLPDLAEQELLYLKTVKLPSGLSQEGLSIAVALLDDSLESTLPGGIGGPLRFDAFLARSYDFEVYPHGQTHLEMRFTAHPDAGVTLTQLQEAFEAALGASLKDGLPQETFSKIKERHLSDLNGVQDIPKYTFEAVRSDVTHRAPISSYHDDLQALKATSLDDMNHLYHALMGDGRVIFRHLYPEQ